MLLAQGMKIPEVAKAIGIHEITYYRWRKEYGGMKGSQAKRLKEPEKENLSVAGPVCVWCVSVMEYLSAEHAVCWAIRRWLPGRRRRRRQPSARSRFG